MQVAGGRDAHADFAAWWSVYPRKVGKKVAATAYARACREITPDALLAATERFRDDPNRRDEFTPHPATWLNQGRWDDDPLPARNGNRSDDRHAANLALVAEFAQQQPRELGWGS